MQLTIRLLREADGRWIADVSELPRVTVYGASPEEATVKVKALALRVTAEKAHNGDARQADISICWSPTKRGT